MRAWDSRIGRAHGSAKFLLFDECGCSELAGKLLACLFSKKLPGKSVGAWDGAGGDASQRLRARGSRRALGAEGRWGLGLVWKASSPRPLRPFVPLAGKGLSSSQILTHATARGLPEHP